MEVENPNKLDDMTVKKIEEALLMDCTVREVCLYANISKQTFYNWQESFPELKERFDQLRETPVLKARSNITKKIESGDVEISKWFLERKKKKEFGANIDLTTDGKPLPQPLLGGQSNVSSNTSNQEVATTEETD